jgi:ATP-binding cassette, subfamily B, bacterial
MPSPAAGPSRRDGWRLLGEAVRNHRGWVIVGVLAGLVWTAAKVTIPTLTKHAVDGGIVKNDSGALLMWALIIVAVGIVSAVCTGLRRYAAFGIAYRAETELRDRLFAHLQRLHFAFHDQTQTGQLMSRAATDLQQINGFVVLIPITISNALTVGSVAVILLLINAKLAILALFALPALNVFARRFSSQIHPVSLELQQQLARVSEVVEETVTGIRVVKGFGAEQLQADRLRERTDRVYDRAITAARIRARFMPLLDFLPLLGLLAVLWYGGHQVIAHKLTLGGLIAFNTYIVMLIVPLRMTGMLIAQTQRAVAAAQRIHEILATAPAITDSPRARPLPVGRGALRFEGVSFGYVPNAAHPVLDGFDLVLRPGEAVALVGATGSGKTTVARLIPRFYDVDGGRVLLDGVDVRELKLRELRKTVGIVFEDTFLFSDTIRANIAFAQPDASQERVEEAARLSGAHDFIESLPDGYETQIGERGFSLSGGQRQRIALARAIIADPRILILDDATSSVDPTKEHEIRAALATVMEGRTTLVIAHRPATIALADRVVLMDEGRVVAEGTHEGLLATNERYRQVLAQAEGTEGGGGDDAPVPIVSAP